MTIDAAQPTEGRVEAEGLSLRYRDWPLREAELTADGVSALALHGFALNAHSWDEVAPALNDVLRLIAIDQRGHGLSDRAAELSEYSREHMVADIGAVIAALNLDHPILIGHSMGGMNAMSFAAAQPDAVRALVLVDVGPEVSVDGANEVKRFVAGPYEMESLDAWVDHTHQYYPWRSKDRIRARLEVSLTQTESGAFGKQYDARFREADFGGVRAAQDELWQVAKALRCPTLLLHGAKSPVLTAEGAQVFADAVDVVRLVHIEEAGHSVAGDQPEAFVAAVRDFLNDVL